MDSKSTSGSTASDQLAAMLQNATIDKAKGNEFSNTAGDMFKFMVNNNYYKFVKEGENMILESSDPISHLLKAIPHFLAEVHKNDQSRTTVIETSGADCSDSVPLAVVSDPVPERDLVDVIDMVPPEPSSLPVSSNADRYTRSMLKCFAGYPLYEPQPFSELSTEYTRHGVNIGDVGFIRGDGVFDFLFNICPPQNSLINPSMLPDGFSLDISEFSGTRAMRPLPHETYLFQSPIKRTKSGEYICEGQEGAVLELPDGAIEDEATNIRPFEKLAARHGVQWYEYTLNRGRKISNGSLYLITSFTKCAQWGIAVFDRPCTQGEGLKFDKKRSLPFGKSTSKYHWKGSRVFPTKVSNRDPGDAPNQCVFLRGYKIMIRQDIFDTICNNQSCGSEPAMLSSPPKDGINMTRQPATRIRGGGGTDPSKKLKGRGLFSGSQPFSTTKSDAVVLHANFNSSLDHPSDLINAALLIQNTDAKVALTHDDIWCDLLRDNFPKFRYATLINIARSYTKLLDEYGCVTLEKTSDPNNGLIQTLKGTKAPTLQRLLSTPDDGYAAAVLSPTISVTLPHELVERILLLLDTRSMLTCRLVNSEFNQIIQSSTPLQYFVACKTAGVIDNPQSPLSYAERLEALKRQEGAWRKLKPVFETTIDGFPHQTPDSISRFIEGAYFCSDSDCKYLKYCHLPSSPQDDPRWKELPSHGPAEELPTTWRNMETAAYEHDLIVNILSSEFVIGNQTDIGRHSLDLIFLKFSTGEYHPLARHPRIHVLRSSEAKPRALCRVSGDNIALIVGSYYGSFFSKLFIFDWKIGHKRLQHDADEDAYRGLVFISPELLLVTNLVLYHFEIWHLPLPCPNALPPVQILSLKIPTLSPQYSLYSFDCRGEPNPYLHPLSYIPPRPFFSSPEESIIVAKVKMTSSESHQRPSYDFIMHRHALVNTVQKWSSPSFLEQQKDLPPWLTNEVTLHKTIDPDDGSVRPEAQSKLGSTIPNASPRTRDSPIFSASQIFADSGPSSISPGSSTISPTSQCDFLQIPWAEWGPPISRWIQIDRTQAQRISHSAGQRYVFSDPNPDDMQKLMISVLDFNPHNVRKHAEMSTQLRCGESKDNDDTGNEELEVFDHEGTFSEEVRMGLKCVVYRVPGEYDFDTVWMDQERLLGVKLNNEGWEESIKVLYIG